jgi:protein gp37
MADITNIAWTDHTFNPWMGCVKASAGCANCYAELLVTQRMNMPGLWGNGSIRKKTGSAVWSKPKSWNKDAEASKRIHLVFCASLCDIFEDHPKANEIRPEVFDLIRSTPWVHYQLLTKRPQNIAKMLPSDWGQGWENVWLGTTVEDAKVAWRLDHLRSIPATVRFVSYEPAIGPLAGLVDLTGIDWLIYGGESGPGFRPHDPQWARDMIPWCEKFGTTYFFKQASAFRTEQIIHLDGKIIRKFPTPRNIITVPFELSPWVDGKRIVPWASHDEVRFDLDEPNNYNGKALPNFSR